MTRVLTVLAIAGAVAVAGCRKPPEAGAQATFSGQTYPLSDCQGAPAASGSPYLIQIGSDFQLRKGTVTITGTQGSNGGSHKHKTPLDLITLIKGGSAVNIRIELTDASLHFNQDMAILGADSTAPSHFCGVTLDTGADPRGITFRVYPDAAGQLSSDYNLALLADQNGGKTGPMPVIIDPWVDNDGINAGKK